MAKQVVSYKIDIDTAEAANSLGGLEDSIDKLKKLRDGQPIGSKAFNDLAKAVQKAEAKVKDVELAFESLDVEQKLTAGTDAVVGLAGGFAAAQGAMGLMGVESEALEATLTKVASALALSSGLRDLGNGIIAMRKLGVGAKAYGVIQKGVNAILKISPIFLLVGTITLVVLALKRLEEAWGGVADGTATAAEVQEGYNKVQDASLESAVKEINTLDNLIRTVKSETATRKEKNAAIKQIQKDYPEYLGNISEEDVLTGRLNGNIAKQTKLIQLRAEAAAAATLQEEAQLKLLRVRIGVENATEVSTQDKVAAIISGNTAQEEFIKRSTEAYLAAKKEVNVINEVTKEINDKVTAIESEAVAEGGKIKTIKAVSKAKTEAKVVETREVKDFSKLMADIEQLENEFLDNQLSRQDQELNAIRDKFNETIELAKQQGFDTALLLEAQETELAEIKKRYRDEEAQALEDELTASNAAADENFESEKDRIKRLADEKNAQIQEDLNVASETIGILGNLNDTFVKDEEKREKIKKALAVAQIAVDTARGISAAIAAGAGILFPGNIPAIISGVAAVVGGIAQAKSVLGDSSSTPSISGATGAASGSSGADINQISNTSTLVDQNQQNLTQKVVVLESDITGAVNNVANVEQTATF